MIETIERVTGFTVSVMPAGPRGGEHRWSHEQRWPDGQVARQVATHGGAVLVRYPRRMDVEIAGDGVVCHPWPGMSDADTQRLLTEQVLPVLLAHRGRLVVHGAAVGTAEGALMLLGESGVGKSTLAARLCSEGATLIADDYFALEDDGAVRALLPATTERAHPRALYLLTPGSSETRPVGELREALLALARACMGYWISYPEDRMAALMRTLTSWVSRVPVFRMAPGPLAVRDIRRSLDQLVAPLTSPTPQVQGALHLEHGDAKASLEAFERALRAAPDEPRAHWNVAVNRLLLGDLAGGWSEYEWRLRFPEMEMHMRPWAALPRWQGEVMPDKRLVVVSEQGFGDILQFARFIPALRARVAEISIDCGPELARLLSSAPGLDRIRVTRVGRPPAPDDDMHLPLLSAPLVLGTTLETLPRDVPYLAAPAEDRARWRARIEEGRARRSVGICWTGSVKHRGNATRSCPLEAFAPLARIPEVALYSLQKGLSANASFPIIDLTAELRDFADTAALIEALDLVITVDTAVAHLAGALGRPVWVLLAALPDWRWMLERSDSPWYPTMRLFRQQRAGDWATVVGAVADALQAS